MVRAEPAAYLSPGRTTSLQDIALELANDAVYLESERVSIQRFGLWFIVAASDDWLVKGSKWQVPEVFFRIQLFHEYRKNSTRATVLATAFANEVVTFLGAMPVVVQGTPSDLDALQSIVQTQHSLSRVVAFRGSYEQTAA
jgi:hypothetical protein